MYTFLNITYSAEVVAENLEILNAVDTAHLVKDCLEGDNKVITMENVIGFSPSECSKKFPGLSKIDFEYRIEDLEDSSLIKQSSGYDYSKSIPSHSIFINIVTTNGEVHVGRLYVQVES
jgi:hypothetical protein